VIVVSNATPLIALAKLGHFALLQKLFTEVTISQEVWTEVVTQGAGRPGAAETSQAAWIRVVPLAQPALLPIWRSAYNLGAGETSTILLAKELSATLALIDERQARNLALKEGIAISGSIAVLESGYRQGHLSDLRQVYAQLLAANLYIAKHKLNQSLASFNLPPL